MSDPTKPPLTTTTSILPAMTVLLIAVVTLVGFMVLNLVANPRVSTTTTIPIVVGGLATQKGSTLLQGCQQPGNPPSNISGALMVPVGTHANGATQHPNGGAGDFDCFRSLLTRATSGEILGYYSAHLEALGWSLFSQGSSSGGAQILFQKAGSDTFYWIVGVTINHHLSGVTTWTYRIYQNSSAI